MSEYRIFETEEFSKSLGKLELYDQGFIRNKLQTFIYPQLRIEPCFGSNVKKLRGYNPSVWRYRIGRFRLFYSVDQNESIVYILTIEKRKDAYR